MLILQGTLFAGLILGVMDGLWLGLIARDWLAGQLGPLKRESFLIAPAIGFYALYSVGMAVFAVTPAVESGGWMRAALLGGFLGLVAFGTYDLTNMATLKGWPAPMTFVDMAWGTVVSAVSSAGAVLIIGLFSRQPG
jgi:uncharacterized membrane protein